MTEVHPKSSTARARLSTAPRPIEAPSQTRRRGRLRGQAFAEVFFFPRVYDACAASVPQEVHIHTTVAAARGAPAWAVCMPQNCTKIPACGNNRSDAAWGGPQSCPCPPASLPAWCRRLHAESVCVGRLRPRAAPGLHPQALGRGCDNHLPAERGRSGGRRRAAANEDAAGTYVHAPHKRSSTMRALSECTPRPPKSCWRHCYATLFGHR